MYCTDKPCIGLNTTANPYLYARFGVVLASLRLLIDNAELQMEMDDEVDPGNTPPSLLTAQVCHSGHVFL